MIVRSRPARGEWIEISADAIAAATASLSRPARGEWIEIYKTFEIGGMGYVSPREGRVD